MTNAFLNLRTAMRNAGYADSAWTLLAQTYSSPVPRGAQIRYSQNGFSRTWASANALDDERHPCGARIGKGRRASAVSACAVTHTGVWLLVRE